MGEEQQQHSLVEPVEQQAEQHQDVVQQLAVERAGSDASSQNLQPPEDTTWEQPQAAAEDIADSLPEQHVADVLSCAGVLVRNRGTLAAAWHRTQQQLTAQQQLVQEWQHFSACQALRYVPAPPNPGRRVLQESACYRLRVLHVDNLPPPQLGSSAGYGLQLGFTLFDQAVGQFYGNTCYSLVEPLQQQQQHTGEAGAAGRSSEPAVDFAFDAFFHSVISDPGCLAVVELILVELEEDGSCKTKYSAGWTQLPVCLHKGSAGAGLLGKQVMGSQAPASAPVMRGTPRYLQLRAVCGDQMPAPSVLGSCTVTYQVEAYPAMNPARALLPPDFLVTHTDIIPGLTRFDLAGQPTTALHSSLSTLASPVLAAPWAVSLEGVQLAVPQLLHNLLSVLPQLLGAIPPPELASLLSVPCQPEAVTYSLRLRVHNGRTFLGPWVAAQLQVHLGSLLLSPAPGQELAVEWLLQDRLVVLVLEMLAEPTAAAAAAAGTQDEPASAPVLVGRAVLAPVADMGVDGSAAVLAEGMHTLCFDSTVCVGSAASSSCWAPAGCGSSVLAGGGSGEAGDLLLPLNWRAMLADTATRSVPDPTVQLDLQQCSKTPRLPATAAVSNSASSPAHTSTVLPQTGAEQNQAVPSGLGAACPASPAAAAAVTAQPVVLHASLEAGTPATPHESPVVHDSPAARSLRLAAQHLEEAANIPVQTPCTTTSGDSQPQEAVDGQADTASRQQLQQLAEAMQQQLDLLATAVAELRQERQTLRSSLTLLESAQHAAAAAGHSTDSRPHQQPAQQLSTPPDVQQQVQQYDSGGGSTNRAGPTDLGWLAAVPEAGQGDVAAFSGQTLQQPYQGLAPSRAVLQQLHEAGMVHALPADIQARVQAHSCLNQGHPHHQQQQRQLQHGPTSRMAALLLDVEARDPRTTSDVVLQLLALRPSPDPASALQLPSSLSSVYFTLQFYKCGPLVTPTCLLAAGAQEQHPQAWQLQQQCGAGGGRPEPAGQAPPTFVLLPQQQGGAGPAGAGLVLKFHVDGSRPSELLPGQGADQGVAQAHAAFCRYLLSHRLAVDVWDGDSLLQLGSCSTDLTGLLRQGRDLADLLLELPLMRVNCSQEGSTAAAAATATAAAGTSAHQQPRGQVQLGTLVLRLINMGSEPSNPAGQVPACSALLAAPGTPGKKVCVRAAPLQPGSPVAKELRGGSSPFAVDWQQCSSGGGTRTGEGGEGGPDVSASTEAAATAADIIGFEQRKVAREQRLRELVHSPAGSPKKHSSPGALQGHPHSTARHSPARKLTAATWSHGSPSKGQQQQQWRPGSPLSTLAAGEEGGAVCDDATLSFKALQQQLLSDVDAVRKRQKPAFIRSQLRKGLVTQCSIRASPGQALLLEHTLSNSLGRDAVFELRVSHPQELNPVEGLQELRDLQQSLGTGINTAADAAQAGSPRQAAAATAAAGAAAPLGLRQLAQHAAAGGGAAAGGKALAKGGRIFLAAGEVASIPFRFMLLEPELSGTAGDSNSKQPFPQQQQQQQQRQVVVEFVPLGLDWPVSILELSVQPEPAVVDRTLRYHCPERELLHVELPLAQLPAASAALLAAAAAGKLTASASRPDVAVTLLMREQIAAGEAAGCTPGLQQQQQGQGQHEPLQQQQACVCIRCRCGAAHEAVQFHVWLYGDPAMALPLEAWQVCVNPLQRVDMRATVGQQSRTTLAIAGGASDRLVAVYSSHPAELQASPANLSLPAGGISALGLVFTPQSPVQQQVRVHVVDVNTRQLVHALVVCTEAHLPPLHRKMEVTVHAGAVSQHNLEVSNSSSRHASYVATTNTPWLLSVAPSGPQHVPAGSRRVLSLVCDARSLAAGSSVCGLVFVRDAQNSLAHEECVVVSVRVV